MPLTKELGRFVTGLTFERLPKEAVEIARTGFIDTIATMIAGAHDPAPQLLRRGLAPPPPTATPYFSGESPPPPEAAGVHRPPGPPPPSHHIRCPGPAFNARVSAPPAEAGFPASPDALEHPQGFLSAVSPEGRADRDGPIPGLGAEWKIVKQGLSIKKYPACYCTHRALDGMLELLAKRPLKPAEIGKITVSISETHSLILRNHTPETGL